MSFILYKIDKLESVSIKGHESLNIRDDKKIAEGDFHFSFFISALKWFKDQR